MTTDQMAKLATQMAELSDKICRLEDLGKDAPRGTIRGLKQRLDALRVLATQERELEPEDESIEELVARVRRETNADIRSIYKRLAGAPVVGAAGTAIDKAIATARSRRVAP